MAVCIEELKAQLCGALTAECLQRERWLRILVLLCRRTIVALVYNVLKTLMEMNGTLFDELTSSYKADRQR